MHRSAILVALLLASGCGWPTRLALVSEVRGDIAAIASFEDVRGVNGYPSEALVRESYGPGE